MEKYNYKENSQSTRSGVPRNPSYPSDWPNIRQDVLNRDHHECRYCGIRDLQFPLQAHPVNPDAQLPLQVHHVKPISKGGKHDFANLVSLCLKCHSHVHLHNKTLAAGYVHMLEKINYYRLYERNIDEYYLDKGITLRQPVPEDYYYPDECYLDKGTPLKQLVLEDYYPDEYSF